jgi:hypothetical protein
MKHATHTLIVSVAATMLGVPVAQGSTEAPSAPEPVVSTVVAASEPDLDPPGIYGADVELTAVIDAAINRYNTTGFSLDPMRFYAHPTDDTCKGNKALFGQNGELDRIDLCSGRTFAIVLHELAHAWEHNNMSDNTRQAFLDYTGLVWYDPDVNWRNRGNEVAANTIAWGLRETPLTATDIGNYSELLHRFELLTGIPSPRLPSTQPSYTRGV